MKLRELTILSRIYNKANINYMLSSSKSKWEMTFNATVSYLFVNLYVQNVKK